MYPSLQGKSHSLSFQPPASWVNPYQGVPSFSFLLRLAIQSELHNYILICISMSYTELLHKDHLEQHNLDQSELYKYKCFISIKVDHLGIWTEKFLHEGSLPSIFVECTFSFHLKLCFLDLQTE